MRKLKILILFVFLLMIGISNCYGVTGDKIRTYEYSSETDKINIVCYVEYGMTQSNCTLTYDSSSFKSSISSFQLSNMDFAAADNLFLKVKKDSDGKYEISKIFTKKDAYSCTENGRNVCYNYKTIEQDLASDVNAYCRYNGNKVNVNCAINDNEKKVSCNIDGSAPFASADNIDADYNSFKNGCPDKNNIYLKVEDSSYPLKITNVYNGNPANLCRDNGGYDKCFSIETVYENVNACKYESETGLISVICGYNKHISDKITCSTIYKTPFKASSVDYSTLDTGKFMKQCPGDIYLKASENNNNIEISGVYLGTPANVCRINGGENSCYSIKNMESTFASQISDNKNSNPVSNENSISDVGENYNFDADHFCEGPVQGVFTTLGWVFFIIKIIVPVLLIIMGSIDFAKAILASKDDEIKKSIKTLAMRAVLGILIFFVPTLLNFILNFIDAPGENTASGVYKGTFWDCTRCMLDPNSGACSELGGKK